MFEMRGSLLTSYITTWLCYKWNVQIKIKIVILQDFKAITIGLDETCSKTQCDQITLRTPPRLVHQALSISRKQKGGSNLINFLLIK